MKKEKVLMEIHNRLYEFFGPQGWWPGESAFEVCVGAILTQNASWKNVEKAISNLKKEGLLDPFKLYELPLEKLAQFIRPSGFYNLKAKRLKNFINCLVEKYEGSVERLFDSSRDMWEIRRELLEIKGLGKETVDSMLLYAGNFPIFVVDAYTYRIFSRHGLIPEEIDYDELQSFFMENLPQDPGLFNEYHALLVVCGKNFCRKKSPLCNKCPLKEIEG